MVEVKELVKKKIVENLSKTNTIDTVESALAEAIKKKMLMEMARELGILKPHEDEGSEVLTRDYVEIAKAIAELPPDKRSEVLSIISMLRSRPTDSSVVLVPLLLGLLKGEGSNPGGNQVVAKLIDALVGRTSNQNSEVAEAIKQLGNIVSKVLETLSSRRVESLSVKDLVELINAVRPTQQGFTLDDFMKMYEFVSKHAGGGGGVDPKVMLEIEKIRQERDLKLAELGLKKYELDVERERVDKLGQHIAKGLDVISRVVEEYEESEEKEGEKKEKTTVRVKCPECGEEQEVPLELGKVFTCTKCGTKFRIRTR